MFEKEAEEAGNKKIKENHQFARCARKSYKDGFQDGATFGYNKANETQKIEFIKELEEEKCELLGIIQGKDKVIQELEKENAELKDKLENLDMCEAKAKALAAEMQEKEPDASWEAMNGDGE